MSSSAPESRLSPDERPPSAAAERSAAAAASGMAMTGLMPPDEIRSACPASAPRKNCPSPPRFTAPALSAMKAPAAATASTDAASSMLPSAYVEEQGPR